MLSGRPTEQGCSWGSPEPLSEESTGRASLATSFGYSQGAPLAFTRWFRFSRLSRGRMSPTMRPGSSGKCREVRQGHSFRGTTPGPGDLESQESSEAGRGSPEHTRLLSSPVTCDLEVQPPQGPRATRGPTSLATTHATKKLNAHTLGPFAEGPSAPSIAHGHRGQVGETDTSHHLHSRARRRGAASVYKSVGTHHSCP